MSYQSTVLILILVKARPILVFTGPCIPYAVASCKVANTSQFNASYGCPYRYHPGEVIVKGCGHATVFSPNKDGCLMLRSDAEFHEDAASSLPKKPYKGVKGENVTFGLLAFNMVWNFALDYMHCICIGVVMGITYLWTESKHHGESYYLGNKLPELNNQFIKCVPTSDISSAP